jgi:transaldolase
MAMGELGCQHATIPEDILLQLSMLTVEANPPPGSDATRDDVSSSRLAALLGTDPLAGPQGPRGQALTDVDYLADNGAALSKAIEEDPTTSRGLFEALEAFKANELQSKAAIEEAMREVS